MIATLPRGVRGIDEAPAQSLLTNVALAAPNKSLDKPLNFAGGLSLAPDVLKSKPAVLLPLFRDFGSTMQATVDHLHQIQKASQTFRIVVSTDMPIFKSLRPYGWAVSHVQSEMQWNPDNGSWRNYVEDELLGVARDFGVRLVFDFSSIEALHNSWKKLLAMAGLPESLAPSNLFLGTGLEHSSWRGWLPTVSSGASAHVVQVNDVYRWNVELYKFADSSMLFVSELTSKSRELARIARQRGWNTALLSVVPEKPPAVEINAALLHLFDGLSLAGAGIANGGMGKQSKTTNLPATLFVQDISESDFDRSERKALAFWSSQR
ncbi:hypothetical protein [Glutamicibacter nicotianae]|uniref:hypothetical protein n=1 Tax=Glutamicibacter nicotianae TaxID=37929 RepID=UPI0013CED2EB|nr:hypothetical protein [Glutamicibacter nicotianae]